MNCFVLVTTFLQEKDSILKEPLVSVLLPVYNAESYLKEAIQSVLEQTYKNIELIIIDDGSTDNSGSIIIDYQAKDKRVNSYSNNGNKGIVYSLNRGIRICSGEFIARMDADDICYPERLTYQVNYLLKKSHIGIVGAEHELIDDSGHIISRNLRRKPTDPSYIEWRSFFTNPLAHSTVVFRRSVISDFRYEEEFFPSEDYRLWTILIKENRIGIYPKPLIKYRVHPESISANRNSQQQKMAAKILRDHWLRNVEEKLSENEANFLSRFHLGKEIDPETNSIKLAFKIVKLCSYLYSKYQTVDIAVLKDMNQILLYLFLQNRYRISVNNFLIIFRIIQNKVSILFNVIYGK